MATAVATTRKPSDIELLITSDQARAYIEPFLPKGVDIQRVAASVMLAIRNDQTGKLKDCTKESLVLGVARIIQWRLELGVTAHLIPFGKTATPVADYKGLCELMIASKAVRYVEAREVREGDVFTFKFGLDAKLDHQPFGGRERTKKPITHVYCIVHLPFGRTAFDVMSAEEVEEIRQNHSKQWKSGPLPAWYAKKSIIRRTAKLLPKNPELAQFFSALESDRVIEVEGIDPDGGDARPALSVRAGADDDDMPRAPVEMDDRWIVDKEREPGQEG